ncbi:MAG: hypothetical protein AB7I41_11700 [Candidatus Sericytochromatia bacterium]
MPRPSSVPNYRQSRKARGDRQISFWLSAEEFEALETARKAQGLSAKEWFLQGLNRASPPVSQQSVAWKEAQLQAEAARGELFAFAGQQDFLLVQIVLDRDLLPEWHPLEVTCLKGFDSAEAAIGYFCQHPAEFPKFAQIVLMHRAGEGHLGFVPEPADWYYTAHLLFEVYPRQMNSYGDYATYEALLERGMLA